MREHLIAIIKAAQSEFYPRSAYSLQDTSDILHYNVRMLSFGSLRGEKVQYSDVRTSPIELSVEEAVDRFLASMEEKV